MKCTYPVSPRMKIELFKSLLRHQLKYVDVKLVVRFTNSEVLWTKCTRKLPLNYLIRYFMNCIVVSYRLLTESGS
jgi:hypothetical protein